jgi:D-alanyl-D-alanine carboxypeptidase
MIAISSIATIILISCTAGILIIKAGSKDRASTPTASDSNNDFVYISPIPEDDAEITEAPEPVIDDEVTSFVPASEMDLDPHSITVYVNKEFCLPKDYKPEDLVTPNIRFNLLTYDERTMLRSEAAKAIERLFFAAEKEGLSLYGVSGYRSYARQWKIFTNNIATQGKEHTLKYSAVPGTSEHQTGLSMDVSTKDLRFKLDDTFEDTPEGKWLAKNSYKYGFIIRYPKDKADITGYAYEPWHIRYVGRGLSYYLHEKNLTLDEYYNYTPDPNFNFEALYADIINYAPPSLPPTITPTEIPVTVEATPTVAATPTESPDKPDKGSDTDNSGEDDSETDPGVTPIPSVTPTPSVTEAPLADSTDQGNSGNKADNSDTTTKKNVL